MDPPTGLLADERPGLKHEWTVLPITFLAADAQKTLVSAIVGIMPVTVKSGLDCPVIDHFVIIRSKWYANKNNNE